MARQARPDAADCGKTAENSGKTMAVKTSAGTRWLGTAIACLIFICGVGALSLVATGMVRAATFKPPTGEAPTGNIPVTVWNALDLPTGSTQQASAAIVIDGGGPPPA